MYKSIGLFVAALSFSGCLLGQGQKPDQIQQEYAHLISAADAKKHLTIVASAAFEGRNPGTKGIEKAAHYLADEFKKLGLIAPVNGSCFQQVPLVKTQFKVRQFSINGQQLNLGKDFFIIGSTAPISLNTDSMLFIGYGISDERYDDLSHVSIRGKTVLLINAGEPVNAQGISAVTGSKTVSAWSTSRNKRLQHILEQGPKMIFASSPEVAGMLKQYATYLTKSEVLLKEDYRPGTNQYIGAPIVNLSTTAANILLQQAGTTLNELKQAIDTSGKPQTRSFGVTAAISFGDTVTDLLSENVLGYLEGTDTNLKDELLVLSAHYDHEGINEKGELFPGADDNGSGTVGLLEIAKAFTAAKQAGHGPRRSILFLAVTAEEKGLLGSDYYTRHPVFPLSSTVVDLNMDMIGRIDDKHLQNNHNYVHVIGADKLSPELQHINEEANQLYTQMELDYMYNDPADPLKLYYRSDHYNFARNDIPVIFYFGGLHPDYHTPGDTVDKINFDMLTKRARLIFHAAWTIANRDQRLSLNRIKK